MYADRRRAWCNRATEREQHQREKRGKNAKERKKEEKKVTKEKERRNKIAGGESFTQGAHGSLLPATRGRVQHGNPIPRMGGYLVIPAGPLLTIAKSRGTSLNSYFRPRQAHCSL